jgi:hypothetical protein
MYVRLIDTITYVTVLSLLFSAAYLSTSDCIDSIARFSSSPTFSFKVSNYVVSSSAVFISDIVIFIFRSYTQFFFLHFQFLSSSWFYIFFYILEHHFNNTWNSIICHFFCFWRLISFMVVAYIFLLFHI